jgi:hypothetical protein
MERVVTAPSLKHGQYGRTDNPLSRRTGDARDGRSHVGELTSDSARTSGAWRRPHTHHSARERVGIVLWWATVAAMATVVLVYALKQASS